MTTRPTDAALRAWWLLQPQERRACSYCGRAGPLPLVQPVHPWYSGGHTEAGQPVERGHIGLCRCVACYVREAANDDQHGRLAELGLLRGQAVEGLR